MKSKKGALDNKKVQAKSKTNEENFPRSACSVWTQYAKETPNGQATSVCQYVLIPNCETLGNYGPGKPQLASGVFACVRAIQDQTVGVFLGVCRCWASLCFACSGLRPSFCPIVPQIKCFCPQWQSKQGVHPQGDDTRAVTEEATVSQLFKHRVSPTWPPWHSQQMRMRCAQPQHCLRKRSYSRSQNLDLLHLHKIFANARSTATALHRRTLWNDIAFPPYSEIK